MCNALKMCSFLMNFFPVSRCFPARNTRARTGQKPGATMEGFGEGGQEFVVTLHIAGVAGVGTALNNISLSCRREASIIMRLSPGCTDPLQANLQKERTTPDSEHAMADACFRPGHGLDVMRPRPLRASRPLGGAEVPETRVYPGTLEMVRSCLPDRNLRRTSCRDCSPFKGG